MKRTKMDSASAIPEVPAQLQGLVTVLTGVFIAVGAAFAYFRRKPEPSSSTDVQIVGGALADRHSTMRLVESIENAADIFKDAVRVLERMNDLHVQDMNQRIAAAEKIARATEQLAQETRYAAERNRQ